MQRTRIYLIGMAGAAALALGLVPVPATAGSTDVRSALTRAAGAPDDDAKGEVRIRSDDKGREELEVKAENIDPSIDHLLYMDDGTGTLVFVGMLEPEDADEVRFRVRTKDGDALPLGATAVADLVGRAVEVRQDPGGGEQLLLEGAVPSLSADGKGRARLKLDTTTFAPEKAKARLKLRSRPAKGDERFELDAKKLDFDAGQDYHVFVEDPASPGTLVDVATMVRRNDSRNARYRARTKDGDPLPHNVASVSDLTGLAIEIVDVTSGNTIFDGVIPAVD